MLCTAIAAELAVAGSGVTASAGQRRGDVEIRLPSGSSREPELGL